MISQLVKPFSLFLGMVVAWFQPLQIQHGQNGCCAECAFIKDEDKIEVIHEEEVNTTC